MAGLGSFEQVIVIIIILLSSKVVIFSVEHPINKKFYLNMKMVVCIVNQNWVDLFYTYFPHSLQNWNMNNANKHDTVIMWTLGYGIYTCASSICYRMCKLTQHFPFRFLFFTQKQHNCTILCAMYFTLEQSPVLSIAVLPLFLLGNIV